MAGETKELHNATLVTSIDVDHRIAIGKPGQTADNIIRDNFFKHIVRSAGNVAVTTGANTITFSTTFGTTDYSLMVYDIDGIGVEVTSQAATGFNLSSLGNGNINYIAIKNI